MPLEVLGVEAWKLPLLVAVGLTAGTINVSAGGGSLLSVPVLIFLGLSPTVANGTNRIAILLQSAGATWSFHKKLLVPWRWVLFAVPVALVGAVLGTWAAISVGDDVFRRILAGVMVVAAGGMVWRPSLSGVLTVEEPLGGWRKIAGFSGFLVMGAYGGFVQAGIGFIAIAIAVSLGLDLIRANAVKLAVILACTPASLWIFARNGSVDWLLGSALALGNLGGGLLGVHLQVLKGHRLVRRVVTVAIVAFAVRLLWYQ